MFRLRPRVFLNVGVALMVVQAFEVSDINRERVQDGSCPPDLWIMCTKKPPRLKSESTPLFPCGLFPEGAGKNRKVSCAIFSGSFFSRVLINGVSLHFYIMSDCRDIMDLALSNSATKLAKHRVVTRPE